jgi:hypothetical protein
MAIISMMLRNFTGATLQRMGYQGNVNSMSGGLPVYMSNGEEYGPIVVQTAGNFGVQFSYLLRRTGSLANLADWDFQPLTQDGVNKNPNMYKIAIYTQLIDERTGKPVTQEQKRQYLKCQEELRADSSKKPKNIPSCQKVIQDSGGNNPNLTKEPSWSRRIVTESSVPDQPLIIGSDFGKTPTDFEGAVDRRVSFTSGRSGETLFVIMDLH